MTRPDFASGWRAAMVVCLVCATLGVIAAAIIVKSGLDTDQKLQQHWQQIEQIKDVQAAHIAASDKYHAAVQSHIERADKYHNEVQMWLESADKRLARLDRIHQWIRTAQDEEEHSHELEESENRNDSPP